MEDLIYTELRPAITRSCVYFVIEIGSTCKMLLKRYSAGLTTCRNVSFGGTCTDVILLRQLLMPTTLYIYDRLNMCYCMLLASYNTGRSRFVK